MNVRESLEMKKKIEDVETLTAELKQAMISFDEKLSALEKKLKKNAD
jgi:hypothetical protein